MCIRDRFKTTLFAKTKQGKRKDGCFHGSCTTFEMKQLYKKFVVALLKVTKGFKYKLNENRKKIFKCNQIDERIEKVREQERGLKQTII